MKSLLTYEAEQKCHSVEEGTALSGRRHLGILMVGRPVGFR